MYGGEVKEHGIIYAQYMSEGDERTIYGARQKSHVEQCVSPLANEFL